MPSLSIFVRGVQQCHLVMRTIVNRYRHCNQVREMLWTRCVHHRRVYLVVHVALLLAIRMYVSSTISRRHQTCYQVTSGVLTLDLDIKDI